LVGTVSWYDLADCSNDAQHESEMYGVGIVVKP